MSAAQRIAVALALALMPALFWFAPGLLSLDTAGFDRAFSGGATRRPLLAALFCVVASRRGNAVERSAWRSFAIGSSLYFVGNVGYMALALMGSTPEFPSLPELCFFLMAGFFAFGMLRFTQLRRRFGAIHIYNFALIYCAVALSAVFVLNHHIANTVLSPFATIVAFLYPALWFSVAAFGVASLVLYTSGRRTVPYGLMVLAMLAEAVADFRYAITLMDGTYELGGITQLLWVCSASLIIWSALEQIGETRRTDIDTETVPPLTRRSDRSIAQATIPAAAVGAILVLGAVSVGGTPYATIAAVLAIAFALIAGFREHWIINMQRRLRLDVEASRSALEASRRQLSAVLESTHDSVLVVDRFWHVTYFNHQAV